ncbi:MAG: FAD-binding oxidoreductase, partial [Ruoffia tabacinasalis]
MKLDNIISEPSRILQGSRIPEAYSVNEHSEIINLHAVAYPLNTQEVVDLVKYANQNDLAIITYGANTGLAEATSAFGGELIIDLSKMNQIIDFDLDTLTLVVDPGVTNGEVQQFVESKGYFYPPDPGAKHGSIGGNVATNAGGMRAVKYGTTRDYVRKMEIVLANGDVIETGSVAIKNSSGYNLNHLFIGSEGTLGIITKVYLKVIPLPKFKQSYIAAFPSLDDAAEAVLSILRNGLDITAVEFFERRAIAYSEQLLNKTFPSENGVAYLLMTFDGMHEAVIQEEAQRLEKITHDHYAVEFLVLSEEDSLTAWDLR